MTQYIGIHSEGGLIPYDVLDKIAKEESGLGQQPKDFGLAAGRRLTDEIARAWSDAQDYWHIFQRRSSSLPENETGATLTRKWVSDLLNELLGYNLTYQQAGAVIGGKNYPISHRAGTGEESPPVDIEGVGLDLDQRPEKRRQSPQALVQEYLNNSDSHLWGIVSNGHLFRLLRDTSRTSRPSYLEFNLQSILEGNRFNEFALFYRVCHRTRLPRTAEDSTSCWLEKYFQLSIEQGGRVRDKLRDGVEDALKTLGTGFLRHPKNEALRERVKAGTLTAGEFHRQLLRLVYRLLFLMVAEERRMIVPESPEADRRQSLFDRYYSVGRLRNLTEKAIEPSTFGDLWIGLQRTFSLFEDGDSNPLGIPPLNGDLFSAIAVKDLHGTHLYNNVLIRAMGRLSLFEDQRIRQRVNYSALDVEELGSVYESLLDFQPVFTEQPEGVAFELRIGSERKSTGSYYTRPELVRELIESALVPVMRDRLAAAKDGDPAKEKEKKQQAILSISVCDPACGSGHFLLAAARRLGRELAKVHTGEDEPTPQEFHLAVRDVIAHCIHGVDVNPLAVDLCKLALWLEGHWTGKPLSFLDHHIKCGNSLIGVLDMKVLEEGIPDGAFDPVTGDDKKVAGAFKKKNKAERKGQYLPFDQLEEHVHQYATESEQFVSITEDTPADVRRKKEAYENARQKPNWWRDWVAANLWTAAFFLPLTKYDDPVVPTHDKFMAYLRGKHVDAQMEGAAIGVATELESFHWLLEFPDVFERGGFEVVLGNPPWESIQLDEKEFFTSIGEHEIATLAGARRKAAIEELDVSKPTVAAAWQKHKRTIETYAKFLRESGRFRLTATGKMNTYALFAELGRNLLSPKARLGILVPTGIATDDGTKDFFGDLVTHQNLTSLVGFENEAFIFPAVHHTFKFCALTVGGERVRADAARLVFFCRYFGDVANAARSFDLSTKDFLLLSPNTRTCPTFRSQADADLTKKIYGNVPVLVREAGDINPWRIEYKQGLFNLTSASSLFERAPGAGLLPLYEAKMIHQFDHRWSTYEGASAENLAAGILPQVPEAKKKTPDYQVRVRYWVPESEVAARMQGWHYRWLLGFRDITSATSERTGIFSILPYLGVGNSLLLILPGIDEQRISVPHVCALLANLNSLVTDFVTRTKLTYLHLSYFVLKQIPVLPPEVYDAESLEFVVPRVLELVCVSDDLRSFATDVWHNSDERLRAAIRARWEESAGCQFETNELIPPFVWDTGRRAQIRAELDAYYAHLHRLTRDEVRYVLDPKDVFGQDFPSETFRVLKEREKKEHGEYRTGRLVLEAFDKLAASPPFRDEMVKRKSGLEIPKKGPQVVVS